MALRGPGGYLRRGPAGPAPQVIARRVGKTSRPTAFPVLPAVAAGLILLASAQLGLWWWQSRMPGLPDRTALHSNPFMALAAQQEAEASKGQVREAQRLGAVVLPQNLQFGDALARVTVTIFTDPSCGACREKIRTWTAGLPVQGVRQVYKFWPQSPERLTPGLLLELARRQGVVPTLWRSLQGAGANDLNDEQMLTMLDHAGVPLAEQRVALTQDGAGLTESLEPDIALAKNAHLPPPPVMMVDDYVLDGEVLSPDSLNVYVKKRLEGRQVLERDDLWLMRK